MKFAIKIKKALAHLHLKLFSNMHSIITPAIMYWGTPVVLISTENEDGSFNIAPMSSAWWLGHRCLLGLSASSQTTQNLLRTKQCVLNLPSDDMGSCINAIARTTGTSEIPPGKQALGYEYCKDKFKRSGLSHQCSDLVRPPHIAERPV
jgi:flavin reductase (DIM6/NTAB) family NADH-FMN oxidoreductase RutF